MAGSLNPVTTRVVACDSGYRLSGRATYASGSAHATWLMAAGIMMRDGAPQMVDGFPLMRAALFPIEQCTILDTWAVSGMRATGSNDCAFEDVFVPEAFTFAWPDATSSWQRGAFATLPLPTQLGVALTAVALGVARHALDVLLEIAVSKVPAGTRASLRERPLAQLQIAQAEGLVQAARAYLYQALRRRVAARRKWRALRRPGTRGGATRVGHRHQARGAGGRPGARRRRHERRADHVRSPAVLA